MFSQLMTKVFFLIVRASASNVTMFKNEVHIVYTPNRLDTHR